MSSLCCDKCVEWLGRKNTSCARLWMDLCTHHALFFIHDGIDVDLRLDEREAKRVHKNILKHLTMLESFGFISTADAPKVFIKIHGKQLMQTIGDLQLVESYCLGEKYHCEQYAKESE